MSGTLDAEPAEFAEDLVSRAICAGADAAQVTAGRGTYFEIDFSERGIDLLRSITNSSASITIFRDGKLGSASVNGCNADDIEAALAAAQTAADAGIKDPANGIADSQFDPLVQRLRKILRQFARGLAKREARQVRIWSRLLRKGRAPDDIGQLFGCGILRTVRTPPWRWNGSAAHRGDPEILRTQAGSWKVCWRCHYHPGLPPVADGKHHERIVRISLVCGHDAL